MHICSAIASVKSCTALKSFAIKTYPSPDEIPLISSSSISVPTATNENIASISEHYFLSTLLVCVCVCVCVRACVRACVHACV